MIKSRHLVTFQIIALILAILLLITACGKKPPKAQPDTARLVKTMVIKSDDAGTYRVYPGRVSASQKVDLSFLVSGRLIKFPITESEEVKKDQLIAQIDPKDYEIKVAQFKAKYDHAKITYDRYKKLLPSDAISKAQYDEKKSLHDLAKANLDEAEKSLSDTYLYAPFSGFVANKYVENYQFVQSNQKIISLQDLSEIEIIIHIPEQDVARAKDVEELSADKGKKKIGMATFASIPDRKFPVTVKEAQTEADPKTQTYKITLLMPMPEKTIILPGMTSSVRIKFSSEKGVYSIPSHAVAVNTKGEHFVWLINMKTMKVAKQIVAVGNMSGENIKIKKGLKPGDRIVTAGVAYLENGMKVKLIEGRIGR